LAQGGARLNALPQFMTEIDGLDMHFTRGSRGLQIPALV
jgi:hypothetical protein